MANETDQVVAPAAAVPEQQSRGRIARRWAKIRHPRLRTKLLVGVLAGTCLALTAQFVISYRTTMGNLNRLEVERMNENLQVGNSTNITWTRKGNITTVPYTTNTFTCLWIPIKPRTVITTS